MPFEFQYRILRSFIAVFKRDRNKVIVIEMIIFGSSVVEIAVENSVRLLMTLSVLIVGWFLVTLVVVVEFVEWHYFGVRFEDM